MPATAPNRITAVLSCFRAKCPPTSNWASLPGHGQTWVKKKVHDAMSQTRSRRARALLSLPKKNMTGFIVKTINFTFREHEFRDLRCIKVHGFDHPMSVSKSLRRRQENVSVARAVKM